MISVAEGGEDGEGNQECRINSAMSDSAKYRLSPNLVDLTRDACWKAWWYKRSLALFLGQHGISDGAVKTVYDHSKIEALSDIFYRLTKKPSRASRDSILSMAKALCEMTTFPDYNNRPDRASRIAEAKAAIDILRPELKKAMAQYTSEQKEAIDKHQREILLRKVADYQAAREASEAALDELIKKLSELAVHAGDKTFAYEFEKWIYDIAKHYDIASRPSFRGDDGHQIDGSITLEGTTLLVEAKLTREQTGRDDIALFLNKINKRAENTRGLFVSIAGFSSQAIKDASCDHTPLILMDNTHLFSLIANKRYTFPELLKRMLANASETGSAYLELKKC